MYRCIHTYYASSAARSSGPMTNYLGRPCARRCLAFVHSLLIEHTPPPKSYRTLSHSLERRSRHQRFPAKYRWQGRLFGSSVIKRKESLQKRCFFVSTTANHIKTSARGYPTGRVFVFRFIGGVVVSRRVEICLWHTHNKHVSCLYSTALSILDHKTEMDTTLLLVVLFVQQGKPAVHGADEYASLTQHAAYKIVLYDSINGSSAIWPRLKLSYIIASSCIESL